jgi:AcrR family transcriptional regulator
VHYYFGSMQDLLLRVVERFTDGLIERQRAMYAADVPFIEKWRTAMGYLEEDLASGYPKVWAELDALAFDKPGLRVRLNAVNDSWRSLLRDALADAIPRNLDGRTQGIMVQLFDHPAQRAIRELPRIHKAFAQLWGTADLIATTDRCGFHPPERDGVPFAGPHLHLDLRSLEPPIPFGLGGLIYLTDTPAEQGAFQCVPGFHRRIDREPPATRDLSGMEGQPIPGAAGDLVIWHHALPHGATPNRGQRPRIVQYIKLHPPPKRPLPARS